MKINFFNHSELVRINKQLESLTQNLRPGDTIKAIHTPAIFPLNTSDEIGGYARSLGFPFGPKRIAINCDRFVKESNSMQKFILARQVALFDKSSRCLHLPLAAVAIAVVAIASSLLFPSSMLAAITIPTIVALAGAAIVAKKERENELYVDLKAFRNCKQKDKRNILRYFSQKSKLEGIAWRKDREREDLWIKYPERVFIKNILSSYPPTLIRYRELVSEWSRNTGIVIPEVRDLITQFQERRNEFKYV